MILSVALPVLVMVTVWGELTVPTFWFEKVRLVGETVTAVASVTPVPVKVIVWGLSRRIVGYGDLVGLRTHCRRGEGDVEGASSSARSKRPDAVIGLGKIAA